MQALQEEIHYASRCDAKVLITGESGVGKEVIARALHGADNLAAGEEALSVGRIGQHARGQRTAAPRTLDRAVQMPVDLRIARQVLPEEVEIADDG